MNIIVGFVATLGFTLFLGEPTVVVKPIGSLVDTTKVEFLGVRDLAAFDDGSVVVADELEYRIKIIDKKGRLVASTGRRGKGPDDFRKGPGNLAVWKNLIAAAEFTGNTIHLFARDLVHLRSFRTPGAVADIGFDSRGILYTTQHTGKKSHILLAYDSLGTLVQVIPLQHASDNIWEQIAIFTVTS